MGSQVLGDPAIASNRNKSIVTFCPHNCLLIILGGTKIGSDQNDFSSNINISEGETSREYISFLLLGFGHIDFDVEYDQDHSVKGNSSHFSATK